MGKIKYRYVFRPEGGQAPFVYPLEIDDQSLLLVSQTPDNHDWTALDFHKCKHCPYSQGEFKHCPVAKNISSAAEAFKAASSFSKTEIYVEAPERTYYKKSSLQDGLFSIFGLVMATSGCAHLDFLRPMARFHLPFSSMEETMARVCSTYLLSQYFERESHPLTQLDLKDLHALYANVEKVNLGILERINYISSGDADKNAMVILHTFTQMIQMQLNSDMEMIRPFFTFKK